MDTVSKLCRIPIIVFLLVWIAGSCQSRDSGGRGCVLDTALDTVSYCIGQDMAKYISQTNGKLDVEMLDLDVVIEGIVSTLEGKNLFTFAESDKIMSEYFKKTLPEKALEGSLEFLKRVEKSDKNIRKTETGLLYEIVKEGNNRRPDIGSVVYLMYEGRRRDGSVFESTYNDYQGEESFPMEFVMKGWQEGLSMIGEGGVIKLWLHPDLAYGETGNERIGPNQALYYYIELIAVI